MRSCSSPLEGSYGSFMKRLSTICTNHSRSSCA